MRYLQQFPRNYSKIFLSFTSIYSSEGLPGYNSSS